MHWFKAADSDSDSNPNTDHTRLNGVAETHARDELPQKSIAIKVKPVDEKEASHQPTGLGGGKQTRHHALNMPADYFSAGSVSDHAKLVMTSSEIWCIANL